MIMEIWQCLVIWKSSINCTVVCRVWRAIWDTESDYVFFT